VENMSRDMVIKFYKKQKYILILVIILVKIAFQERPQF
jgi:hypothetical protein